MCWHGGKRFFLLLASRGSLMERGVDAGDAFAGVAGASDEGFKGPLIVSMTGLGGVVEPLLFIGLKGLATLRLAGAH